MFAEKKWVQPTLVVSLFLIVGSIMLVWTWGTWPDAWVDFGRELYIPWQIIEGKALYQDIAYFHGPLSPYLNTFWFLWGGVSLRTLVVCNILIAAAILLLLYRILLFLGGKLAALIGGLCFLFLFLASQWLTVGNYNFITPYSHEMTHGLLFSLLAIWYYRMYLENQRDRWVFTVGLCLGLVFLTKAEITIAAWGAIFLPWILHWIFSLADKKVIVSWRFPAFVFLGIFSVLLFAFLLLSFAIPWEKALEGILGSWHYLGNSELHHLKFYSTMLGTDEPWLNIANMFLTCGWYLVLLLPVLFLGRILPKKSWLRWTLFGFILIAFSAGTYLAFSNYPIYRNTMKHLPIFLGISGCLLAYRLYRQRKEGQNHNTLWVGLSMVFFSLFLLGKMFLKTTLYHYGFVLALPAAMLFLLFLLDWLPSYLQKFKIDSIFLRGAVLGMVMGAILLNLDLTVHNNKDKTFPIGMGGDVFRTDLRGSQLQKIVLNLWPALGNDHTIIVLPEGVMINYLLRVANPTPYINFMPPEVIAFEEKNMLAAFQSKPPELIVKAYKDVKQYGYEAFGEDYGKDLWAWVTQNYIPIMRLGPEGFETTIFMHRPTFEKNQAEIQKRKKNG